MRRAAVGALVLVAFGSAVANSAAIKTKAGVTRDGDISGLVILKRQVNEPTKGIAYLIIDGKHISAIDEKGVHLAKDTLVRTVFVQGDETPDNVSHVGFAVDMVKTGFKPEFVERPDFFLTIQRGRCCAVSVIQAAVLTDTILGEFREKSPSADALVIPALEIGRGATKVTVPVSDIVSFVR